MQYRQPSPSPYLYTPPLLDRSNQVNSPQPSLAEHYTQLKREHAIPQGTPTANPFLDHKYSYDVCPAHPRDPLVNQTVLKTWYTVGDGSGDNPMVTERTTARSHTWQRVFGRPSITICLLRLPVGLPAFRAWTAGKGVCRRLHARRTVENCSGPHGACEWPLRLDLRHLDGPDLNCDCKGHHSRTELTALRIVVLVSD